MCNIKVITGGMKSGKSEEILRRYKRADRAGVRVQIFKPDTDRRFEEGKVVSRDDRSEDCTIIPAANAEYILSVLDSSTKLVIIDEVQFFQTAIKSMDWIDDRGIRQSGVIEYYPIVKVVQKIADSGIDVVVSGLDMDSNRKPFGAMSELMAIAMEVKKLHAICEICHQPAMYSYANFDKDSQISLGDNKDEKYVATCPRCYNALKEKVLLPIFDENMKRTGYKIVDEVIGRLML